MKVSIRDKKIPVSQIPCGSCFVAQRHNSKEEALYIKVDRSSGHLIDINNYGVPALNLQTGQLRWFDTKVNVQPYEAEVR